MKQSGTKTTNRNQKSHEKCMYKKWQNHYRKTNNTIKRCGGGGFLVTTYLPPMRYTRFVCEVTRCGFIFLDYIFGIRNLCKMTKWPWSKQILSLNTKAQVFPPCHSANPTLLSHNHLDLPPLPRNPLWVSKNWLHNIMFNIGKRIIEMKVSS